MKPRKSRDAALMLVGMVCLAAYVLACLPSRPAFSPDGSKILFSWVDSETGWFTAALYDRTGQDVETIFNFRVPGKPEEGLAMVRWDPDGKRAIVAWREKLGENSIIRVMVLPLGSKNPTRHFLVPVDKELLLESLVIPPPLLHGQLFLGGKTSVRRLDLQTGDIKTQDFGEELDGLVLVENRDQVYYLSKSKGAPSVFEIGNIDKDTLARIPTLRLEEKDVGKISGFFAILKDGSRIAVVSELPLRPPFTDTLRGILIYHGNYLERAIWLGSQPGMDLLNSEWSPDGTVVYTAFVKKLSSEGEYDDGILEVPLNGTSLREIPLIPQRKKDGFDFQIAVSPDGKTIAAFKVQDLALYLIDLASSDRKVTRIPVPSPATPKPGQEEK